MELESSLVLELMLTWRLGLGLQLELGAWVGTEVSGGVGVRVCNWYLMNGIP